MRLRYDKSLITGKPGVGKTTLVQKIIEQMRLVNIAGFCPAEIRCMGSRLGFEGFLETLDLLNPDVGLIVIDEIGAMIF